MNMTWVINVEEIEEKPPEEKPSKINLATLGLALAALLGIGVGLYKGGERK